MTAVHYITAHFVAGRPAQEYRGHVFDAAPDAWRADAHFGGDDTDDLRDRVYRWAGSFNDENGNGPATCVIRLTDTAEANAVYASGFISLREAELLGADVLRSQVAA